VGSVQAPLPCQPVGEPLNTITIPFSGFRSGVAEILVLQGRDTSTLRNRKPTFRSNVVSS
jgi:hypothetical protein